MWYRLVCKICWSQIPNFRTKRVRMRSAIWLNSLYSTRSISRQLRKWTHLLVSRIMLFFGNTRRFMKWVLIGCNYDRERWFAWQNFRCRIRRLRQAYFFYVCLKFKWNQIEIQKVDNSDEIILFVFSSQLRVMSLLMIAKPHSSFASRTQTAVPKKSAHSRQSGSKFSIS